MILPTTYLAAMLLWILAMLAAGSWANTQKMAGKRRFELFYYDFSLGSLLFAAIAALALGSVLSKELTFSDNLLIASKHQMAYALAAGAVFNLANVVLVAAISVSSMSVAFPIAMGLAVVIGVFLNLSVLANPIPLFGGILLLLAAVLIAAIAYTLHLEELRAVKTALQPDPRVKGRTKGPSAARGIILSVASGIVMGLFPPLVQLTREGDGGVAPYGLAVLFGAGIVLSTLLYLPFFLNFPVQGPPLELREYIRGPKKLHWFGLLGGAIWMLGALSGFLAETVPEASSGVGYVLAQSSPIVAALWGVLAWREFQTASYRVKMLLAILLVLFLAGVSLIAVGATRGLR